MDVISDETYLVQRLYASSERSARWQNDRCDVRHDVQSLLHTKSTLCYRAAAAPLFVLNVILICKVISLSLSSFKQLNSSLQREEFADCDVI